MARQEEMPNPSESLVRRSVLMFLSMAIAGVLALLVSVLIARWLVTSDYGLYSIVSSVQTVVLLLAMFGLGTATAKYVAEYRVHSEEQARRFAKSGLVFVLVVSSAICVVYVALSGVIGTGLYKAPAMVRLIPFSALDVLSYALFAVSVGIVQGCQKFRLMAGAQIAPPLLSLIMVFPLFHLMGLSGIFLAFALSQMIVTVVVLFVLNKYEFRFLRARLELHRKSDIVSMLFHFAIPTVLGGLVVTPVVWIANTKLTLDAGLSAMGYFAAANVVYVSLMQIPSAISVPIVPKVSELTVRSRDEIERLLGKALRTLSIALFPLAFGVALFSEIVVEIMYGSRYSAATRVVYLMATASYFYALSAVIGSFVTGMGRMWLWLGLNSLWAGGFLALVFIGVPALGAEGLALSYAAAYCVFLALTITACREVLHLSVKGVYVAGVSAAVFFVIGFFAESVPGPGGLLVRFGLFLVGVVYFCLIGLDVVKSLYRRAVATLFRS